MKRSFLTKFVPLGLLFLLLALLMPRNSKFAYDYRKGREWKYETLFAEFDFPIYKTAEQIREERISTTEKVVPYYRFSSETMNRNLTAAQSRNLGRFHNAVVSELRSIYSKGIVADESRRQKDDIPQSDVIYIQKNKRAVKTPFSEVYRQSEAKAKLLSDLGAVSDFNVDSLLKAEGIYDLIVPNVIYDEQTTKLVNAEERNEISPTSGYVRAGQLIVSKGEIVTSEIEQMLDSYKKELELNVGYLGPTVLVVLGNILLSAALVVLLYFIITFACSSVFADSRYYYIISLYAIAAVLTLLLAAHHDSMLFVVPYSLFAIMLQAFMSPRQIAPVYLAILTPILVSANDGPVLFVMFAVSGLVMIYLFKYFQQGWKQFLAAMINFAIVAIVYLGFKASNLVAGGVVYVILALFIGSMLSVAGYPLVYLFEKIFNLVSNSRLAELCNTSNPLIRQLEQKAPGTFQHSLQVMNMADAVSRLVDVNPDLVRAGALYHDIGKMNNPLCFIENEFMVKSDAKYHSGLTPLQSAKDIIKHVADGLEIAQKHRLPKVVSGFIDTHHGTTVVRFFYNQFLKDGGDPAMIAEFRYTGHKPQTKAQIVVMLCDSVEAASRTIKGNTVQIYSDFVESIVAGKMEEGQFDDADISISELNALKEGLKQYLAQLNHERVVYPKNKLNKK